MHDVSRFVPKKWPFSSGKSIFWCFLLVSFRERSQVPKKGTSENEGCTSVVAPVSGPLSRIHGVGGSALWAENVFPTDLTDTSYLMC